ncbi:MAG: helix-turn-helix domain-containing protein [Saprospiraceae bacterium]|uniref:Helix-turn-helix domain-containing protein n=1 Tax=Candidatus Defluviibacterium haderslevense TaxID=2981993 RepID=A0A9D7S6I9_9BACT|nr:helix-turn-helix domain-containing protein [Candidatus Defluviibacterium haderslevense]MBK9716092.1 helix-turn-helix domain-containing protein [Candidatus Defluviibacterium haderslevense]MBL0238417.1 helix-turn-helix domain-containing protein [Candidatus Defluviibacterium haderslevense]
MHIENIGDYIRQLREQAEMPLRKLAALLDIDQSTLSKLERGERPVSRQMLPIIAKTFKVDEKELVIKFMSKQVAYQLADEKFAKDILIAAEEELSYAKSRIPIKKIKSVSK